MVGIYVYTDTSMYLHHAYNGVYDAMMSTVNASVCSFVKYS